MAMSCIPLSSRLSVLIPDYRNLNRSFGLASKLHNYQQIKDIVIVDDSGDFLPIPEWVVTHRLHKVTILRHSLNRGFAGAVNTGLKFLQAKNSTVCLVLNNDIELHPYTIIEILTVANNINSEIIGFIDSSENSISLKKHSYDISGFCFLIRLSILDKIGYFNETYFMYGEEQDYFYRAYKSQVSILQYPLLVHHASQKSMLAGASVEWRTWLAVRNSVFFSLLSNRPHKALISIFYFYVLSFKLLKRTDASSVRIQQINPVKLTIYLYYTLLWSLLHFTGYNAIARRLSQKFLLKKSNG